MEKKSVLEQVEHMFTFFTKMIEVNLSEGDVFF